jgi:hypothetical protein
LRLLASFEQTLPSSSPRGSSSRRWRRRYLSLSGGTIGEISTLFIRAALRAIDRGIEHITAAELDV